MSPLSTYWKKETNVNMANRLEKKLPRKITFHASNATMFNTWVTTYKSKEKDRHH
jgi:hypothetical protein